MTVERPVDDFRDPPTWPDPANYDKRIRNLSGRVAQLEHEIEQLKSANGGAKRIVPRIFRFGGWK